MNFNEVLMPVAIFGMIALIIKVIADAITRNKLINKGLVDENVKYLFNRYGKSTTTSNIKWGMVLVGIGVAIFIREFAHSTDEVMVGLMFLFAGIAFLAYYPLAKAMDDKNNNNPS